MIQIPTVTRLGSNDPIALGTRIFATSIATRGGELKDTCRAPGLSRKALYERMRRCSLGRNAVADNPGKG